MQNHFKNLAIVVISSSLLMSCAIEGPSKRDIKRSMETQLPGFWDVSFLEREETENLGTKTEPLYKIRFKAKLKTEQNIFTQDRLSNFSRQGQGGVTYLEPKLSKGTSRDFYGVVSASKHQAGWRMSFKFDSSPDLLGQPREFYPGRTIIKGSEEEDQYQRELAEKAQADKLATLNRFFSGEHRGYMSGDLYGRPTIRFTSASVETDKVEGQLIFSKGVIKGFSGSFSENELTFEIKNVVQGEDKIGIGTIYTLRIGELKPNTRKIKGTYKHIDNRTGDVYFNL